MFPSWQSLGILTAAGLLLTAAPVEARPVAVHGGVGVHVGGYYHPGYHPSYYRPSTYHPEHPVYNRYHYYNYYNLGWPLYYGGLYSLPTYNYNVNITPRPPVPLYVPPAAGITQSFYPPSSSYVPPPPPAVGQPSRDPSTTLVQVRVPQANAQVLIDGVKTTQQGSDRQYISPPLIPGKRYSYLIEVKWTADGKETSQTRKVMLQAGQTIRVDFTQPPQAGEEVIATP